MSASKLKSPFASVYASDFSVFSCTLIMKNDVFDCKPPFVRSFLNTFVVVFRIKLVCSLVNQTSESICNLQFLVLFPFNYSLTIYMFVH